MDTEIENLRYVVSDLEILLSEGSSENKLVETDK